MLDPYRTLQVRHDATSEEIKVAYRRLVKQLHPDLRPNDPAAARRFSDVTGAYDLLSDIAKRREYDRGIGLGNRTERKDEAFDVFKRAWSFRNARQKATSPHEEASGVYRNGGAQKKVEPAGRGADIHHTVQVSFLEAAFGARTRVSIGSRTIDVSIPPLTDDGRTLRLKGQGASALNNGAAGDALILIKVTPHALFTRSDLDIRMMLPVSVPEAVLGASVNVPTLFGVVQVKIPAGSNTDSILRLRGKGLRASGGTSQGDQLVALKVILPDSQEPDFIDLVEKWSKRHHYTVRSAGWETNKP